MCNLYACEMTAAEMRSLGMHYRFTGASWTGREEERGRYEPIGEVHPNQRAPVVVLRNGEHILREDMLWGFPKYAEAYGTNFRTLTNPRWKPWLNREHRCVVPATAFALPDRNTPESDRMGRWFSRADKLPFVFAGIWRPWTGNRGSKQAPNVGVHTLFSIMTTDPNAVVEPIHEQAMPVLLMTADAAHRWLNGATVEDALAMQRPAADDALVVGPPVAL
jgi:putative SOS response-associated peptidase YedK